MGIEGIFQWIRLPSESDPRRDFVGRLPDHFPGHFDITQSDVRWL